MRLRAELALAGVTVIWGTTFVVVKGALADVSTMVFLALRFSLAGIALALIYWKAISGKKAGRNALGAGLLAGGLLFTAYLFQTLGLELTTPSKSAFLTGLSIPMVPLASSLVYRNKPRMLEVIGIVIASAGMMLMTLGSSSTVEELRFDMSRGDLLSFFCAVTFALHIVVIGHYSQELGFKSIAVTQIIVAAAAGLFFCGFAEPLRFRLTPGVIGAVLTTGLLATALAFTTQAWAQQYTSATRAALIFSVEPVVAWATSWLLTGETLANRGKVGAGMILASILLVEGTRGLAAETNAAKTTS